MITIKEPSSWQELQTWTANILNEAGISAQVEVRLPTVRGQVEVDVLARELISGREQTTLVECKNWSAKVPQSVVHSFRTVVNDLGANSGYIVSRAGFQSGAYEAAASTNIKLVTWVEFQELFEEQWYWTHFAPLVKEHLDPLCSYLEPIPAMTHWDHYLDPPDVQRLSDLFHQNFSLGALIMAFHPIMARLKGPQTRVRLPLQVGASNYGDLPDNLVRQVAYRELFDELFRYAMPILIEFQSYKDKAFDRKRATEDPLADPHKS